MLGPTAPSSLDEPVDPVARLPARLPWTAWVASTTAFLVSYGFMFSVVHVYVDTHVCLTQLPDPIMALVPPAPGLRFVTHDLYYVFNAAGTLSLAVRAWRGDHRGLVRFGLGLALMAVLRSATLLLLPLCRATVAPGTAALSEVPTLDLGFARVPWRMWATNDLVFSGHVGEFLLLHWATPHWPRWARLTLGAFQILQAFSLIATRGHYTVDVLLAVPCAYFANGLALQAVRLLAGRHRPHRAPSG